MFFSQKIDGAKPTLLDNFFQLKFDNFVEPRRKGVPKGDPIGFSRNKFAASLWMLTDYSKKDIAFQISVSYSLLRNWSTEKEFKKIVNKHHEEFVNYFFDHIVEQNIRNKEFDNKFPDANIYSDDLKNEIIDTFIKKIEERGLSLETKLDMCSLSVELIKRWEGLKLLSFKLSKSVGITPRKIFTSIIASQIEVLRANTLKSFIVEIREALLKPYLEQKEKEQLIQTLNYALNKLI